MNNPIKSAAILVTYNPVESTLDVIKGLLKMNVHLIVVDNGTKVDNLYINEIEKELMKEQETHFLKLEKNEGLATAQNKGIKLCTSLSNEFIFFFDQDTILPNNYISIMEKSFLDYEANYNEKLGILAPNYFDRNTKEYAQYAFLTDKSYEDRIFNNEKYMEVSFVISSGSMMRMSVINEIGTYIDDFFIDQIDTEYSLRMKKSGYKIIATSEVLLNHTIGDREKKKLFGLTIKPNHHSELRKYYIFRNGKVLIDLYGKEYYGFKVLMYKRFIHDILGILFFEKNKVTKIKSIKKGLTDSKLLKEKIERKSYYYE